MKSSPHRPSIELLFKRGLGSAEIARRLQISSSTVRNVVGTLLVVHLSFNKTGHRPMARDRHWPSWRRISLDSWTRTCGLLPARISIRWISGKIAGKVFATVDDLKAALEVAWASIDDGYLRRTVNSVKKRLRACVKARGSNFEILL
uniref:HTH luxR-type domain-containing protein n=1 Tax=Caenorhabditis japonica TaxID=281687 RepID=A0A2Q4THU7_CAEJA